MLTASPQFRLVTVEYMELETAEWQVGGRFRDNCPGAESDAEFNQHDAREVDSRSEVTTEVKYEEACIAHDLAGWRSPLASQSNGIELCPGILLTHSRPHVKLG